MLIRKFGVAYIKQNLRLLVLRETGNRVMGTKVAVAFTNIFMAKVETELLKKSAIKPICWKRYIDYIFSLWGTGREQITHFIEQANNHHATILIVAW